MNYTERNGQKLGEGLARNMLALEGIKQSETRLQDAKKTFDWERAKMRRRENSVIENERIGALRKVADDPQKSFMKCSPPDPDRHEDGAGQELGLGLRSRENRKKTAKVIV